MRRVALDLLLCLLCVQPMHGQSEERVSWSAQVADAPATPLHQFVGASEPSDTARALGAWVGWDDAEPLLCSSTSPSIRATAMRNGRTWMIALWNDSEAKTKVTLEGELPSGIYTVERLLLTESAGISTAERRNGLVQRTNGRVQRTEWLEAHTGMLLRFSETTQTVDETRGALRRSIWQSRTSPGVLSRLAALTREMDSHWYQVRASIRRNDVQMAARGVHRMLFLVSGIRAVSSTYGGLADVSRYAERLIDVLSDMSSALLNVAVMVRRTEQGLDVRVVNAGTQTWKALRLVPDMVKDEEAVVLANVKPMERTEVVFRLAENEPAPAVVVSLLLNGGYARVKVPVEPAEEKEE